MRMQAITLIKLFLHMFYSKIIFKGILKAGGLFQGGTLESGYERVKAGLTLYMLVVPNLANTK